jgi:1-acyl-sn-glycerol-3-phosphate acyltransferase
VPDATVIPIGGDDGGRKAASRAARQAGATGPRPRRTTAPEPAEPADVAPGAAADPDAHDVDGAPGRLDENVADWLDFLRRRITGEYEIDQFGFDAELTDRVLLAPLRPLYNNWFRVETRGIENVPSEGGALVVANHSGTVALDAVMTQLALHDHHPAQRNLRMLGANLVFQMPLVGEIARKSGNTLACNPDAERLLSTGEVVGVWPEGFKGIGKPYRDRYKLQRFGRGGFVATALKTKTPIIPCAIVGAEEIYPIIGNAKTLARLFNLPYFPLTPTFPWLGPLGLVPLPSKWIIEFGEPIHTDQFPDGAADDPMLVFNITDQVRETIQQTLYRLLVQRRSVFR